MFMLISYIDLEGPGLIDHCMLAACKHLAQKFYPTLGFINAYGWMKKIEAAPPKARMRNVCMMLSFMLYFCFGVTKDSGPNKKLKLFCFV